MLVQIAFMLVALFGVAALTVDLGLARVTQSEMQTAADSAAIEGLRYRNISSDGFQSDCRRRVAAADMVRTTFQNTDDDRRYGAGPVIAIDGGVGPADAFTQIDLSDPHAYAPDLQINQTTNDGIGDLVSGTFTSSSAPGPEEDAGYARVDFAPAAAVDAGSSGFEGCPSPIDHPELYDNPAPDAWPDSGVGPIGVADHANGAFLVRLRRTSNRDGLDDVPEVSSHGPALPLLFGRGSAIAGTDVDAGDSLRRDGLTIRATAIAGAMPALAVGQAGGSVGEGAAPFALSSDAYAAVPVDPPTTMVIGADGSIDGGQFTAVPLTRVGEMVPVASPATCDVPISGEGRRAYVPLVDTIGASSRVVGFGRVTFWWSCDTPGDPPGDFRVARGSQHVVSANATAVLADGFPADLPLDDVADLMTRNRQLADAGLAVLVPALVR
ncbi:MAG TPA: Tad domain-containing protein [Vicinamibacterales bacterium]|nr:Tad domain-containing protein [Vicinamibacterales bacterium]